jgi:drug/metabolite transporter (DMT)-like permease
MTRRATGITLAFVTAAISGVSVFVNGYGAKRFAGPTIYTTEKNTVAFLLLASALVLTRSRSRARPVPAPRLARRDLAALVTVGVIGGGVPFILFFEGLARASSTDAAFVHKTLVVWVALLAVPLLHERFRPWHAAAIALLVIGQAALASDLGALRADRGTTMIFAATLLWSVEVVVAKRLLERVEPLTVGVARLGIGLGVLFGWLAVRGTLGNMWPVSGAALWWALVTGTLLAAYVATWFAALARAPAIDVTAVLVAGALVTAVLDTVVHGAAIAPDVPGLLLVVIGAAVVAIGSRRCAPDRVAVTRP